MHFFVPLILSFVPFLGHIPVPMKIENNFAFQQTATKPNLKSFVKTSLGLVYKLNKSLF